MARRAVVIKQQRQEHANLLVLDAGNTIFGQTLSDESSGRAMIEAMNLLGYNAMGLGDADILKGPQILADRAREAKFPFLSANLIDASSKQLVGKPYTIVTVSGRKIGIIGLTGISDAMPQTIKSKFVVNDYLKSAKETLEQVRKETNAVIVLSTLGFDRELKLAKEVPGISLMVGGGGVSQHPTETKVVEETGTVILGNTLYGEGVGTWTMTIDPQGKATNLTGKMITLLKDEHPEDPDLLALIERYQKEQEQQTQPSPQPLNRP
jgi:2',3'-cyclic-nucleotide 2'-phosphodiesterase (5'-nucleotidase family)